MDDYNLSLLIESKNEWCSRLVNLLTPCIFDGLKSIYDESIKICKEEDEMDKYLMTYQNLLTAIPNWSQEIINKEVENIINKTKCDYIDDLITCVHIAHLKSLTTTRVGTQQKKIDIDIPNLSNFIHKIYINTARKIYSNIYLYEINQIPLQKQKNNREIEYIIKECILNTIRENIPIEQILRAYIDETEETEIIVEEKKEIIPLENKKVKGPNMNNNSSLSNDNDNDNDKLSTNNNSENNKEINKEIVIKNITTEIKEIDNLLNTDNHTINNDNDENNNNNKSDDKEINELPFDDSINNEDEKIKMSDNDIIVDIQNINSDVEDLELDIEEL